MNSDSCVVACHGRGNGRVVRHVAFSAANRARPGGRRATFAHAMRSLAARAAGPPCQTRWYGSASVLMVVVANPTFSRINARRSSRPRRQSIVRIRASQAAPACFGKTRVPTSIFTTVGTPTSRGRCLSDSGSESDSENSEPGRLRVSESRSPPAPPGPELEHRDFKLPLADPGRHGVL